MWTSIIQQADKKTQKVLMLQEMCNKYGDFQVSTHKNDSSWTKWKSVLYCWENLDKEEWRLKTANNRTIFNDELVLDLDGNQTIKQKEKHITTNIIPTLKKYGIYNYKIYYSGSKGHHIHIIIKMLGTRKLSYQKLIKQTIITKTGCDLAKTTKRTMIALENTPHWKTGKPKTRVYL
jgi:hypothetical protein